MTRHRPPAQAQTTALAASLVCVLLLAKVLGLAGRDLPPSILLPSALFWDDVVLGAVFWGASRWLMPRPVSRAAYWTLVVWAALNVVVVRTLSSPLTVPMLRAAGGALSDSITTYVTPLNVGLIAMVLAAGVLAPRVRTPGPLRTAAMLGAVAIAVPGPFVEARVDARGAHRNAVSALIRSAIPRVPTDVPTDHLSWRASLMEWTPEPDLAWLRGAARGRNVVIVALESTGAQYLRSYGAPDDPMPALTSAARDAVQFDAAYAVYPESIKGLFAVLCSRHPAVDVSAVAHAAAACDPLAGVIGRAGYQRALFHSGRFGYLGMDAIVARQQFERLEDAGVIGGETESSFGIDEASTVSRMFEWVDARDPRRPFLLVYLPIAGHHPYAAPEPLFFQGKGPLVAYRNALRHADASVGALLDGLRSRGLEESTLFVLFGDHGEAFGQHDGNIGHTLFIFEENVRVPLLISVPGVTTGPVRSTRIASVVDIAPTVLDMLGLPRPVSYEGVSLLNGPPAIAYFAADYALAWAGLRDGCWKYLLELETARPRLYDICRDPGERHDLVAAHAAREADYRRRVRGWAAATRHSYTATTSPSTPR